VRHLSLLDLLVLQAQLGRRVQIVLLLDLLAQQGLQVRHLSLLVQQGRQARQDLLVLRHS
jgi:hypothetical protein